jgi:hypothetical protein
MTDTQKCGHPRSMRYPGTPPDNETQADAYCEGCLNDLKAAGQKAIAAAKRRWRSQAVQPEEAK